MNICPESSGDAAAVQRVGAIKAYRLFHRAFMVDLVNAVIP